MNRRPTTAELWALLEPYVQVYAPAGGEPRPAVLLFHGCGGVRRHMEAYGRAAADVGVRAFVVDSYAARRWSRARALALVCTGLRFHGRERAGDVLAAAWGVTRRADVDASRLALAGWSHGAWALMDLMTMPLVVYGEAALADPSPAALSGLRSLFLAYPYGGPGALSRRRGWLHSPAVLGVIPGRDHVTRRGEARRLYDSPRRGGCEVELWEAAEATHSFDEPTGVPPMRYAATLADEARQRFAAFLLRTLRPPRSTAAAR